MATKPKQEEIIAPLEDQDSSMLLEDQDSSMLEESSPYRFLPERGEDYREIEQAELFDEKVTRRELALLNFIRIIQSGNLESVDIHAGRVVSIRSIRSNYNFNDATTVDRFARILDFGDKTFIR